MTKSALLATLLMLPIAAMAHEGHGAGAGYELIHYLGSPVHIIPAAIVLAAAVGFLLFRQSRRSTTRKERVDNQS